MSERSGAETTEAERYDVLEYSDGTHRVVPAGDGAAVRQAHETEARKRRLYATLAVVVMSPAVAVYVGATVLGDILGPLTAGLVVGIVGGIWRFRRWEHDDMLPDLVATAASAHVVSDYIDEFDPDEVISPYK